jgi:hypothetical protein
MISDFNSLQSNGWGTEGITKWDPRIPYLAHLLENEVWQSNVDGKKGQGEFGKFEKW